MVEGFDRARLEALYQRLEKRLFNVIYRWVWQVEVADELVQETFVRLWARRDTVRPETAPALAFTIALNLARNRARWQRLRTFVTGSELVGFEPTPEQAASDSERRERIRTAIERLSERLRRVVVLCDVGGLSYREASEILGIPEGTVASRRHAALKKLKTWMEDPDA